MGGLLLFVLCVESEVWAWGERGHHVICEAATQLLHDEALKKFLLPRSEMMGHLCNIPDIYWRSLDEAHLGNATHYINPEKLKFTVFNLPTDYQEVLKKGSERDVDVPSELGSLWWRADQFYRRALGAAARFKGQAMIPVDLSQGTANATASALNSSDDVYTSAVYDFFVNLGLMGHFVGDASMPYHNTADYDGWAEGHGGIHSYYETESVDAMAPSLLNEVFLRAQSFRGKSKSRQADVVRRMKELSMASFRELYKVQAADKTLRPSKNADSGQSRVPAIRPSASAGARVFRELILAEMARSAAALADFWDSAYVEAGRPDLTRYKSFRYPLTPDFVKPDYLPALQVQEASPSGVAASDIE